MKKLIGLSIGRCFVFAGLVAVGHVAVAQEFPPPPKVLVIQREVLKPGRAGNTHLKTESAFVNAMAAAKWPTPYFAADSMSGLSRSLFFIGYPSLEAWEKDNQAMAKNATLTAAFDRASYADGEQLSEYSSGVFVFNEKMSLRAGVDIPHMRYFEISQFKVKPGHEQDWDELVKMYKSGYEKIANARWAVFGSMYGVDNGGLFLVFVPMQSLAEADKNMADSETFAAALGEGGMKKLGELTAACVETTQTNLFQFNPKMSFPDAEWVKADPGFWKPKTAIGGKTVATQ
jgi:hypothetical protein